MSEPTAKEFQDPLLLTLMDLSEGQVGRAVPHTDVYGPLCERMGFEVKAHGQNPDSKYKSVQWIQWAYKNLKRTGHVLDQGRGQWSLSQLGVDTVNSMQTSNNDTTQTVPSEEGVSSLVTGGYPDSPEYPDPYIQSLVTERIPCFGGFSDRATFCERCPVQGACINHAASELTALAAVLDAEDKAGEVPQKAAEPKTTDGWDWSEWDLNGVRTLIAKAEGRCPRCREPILKETKAVWLRMNPKGTKHRGVMFHSECGPTGPGRGA